MENNIIEMKNLTKRYGKKTILNGLNFSLKENERIAIVGANGSGKTTLLNIISKNDKKYEGKYFLGIERGDISFQIQTSNYSRGFNIKELMYLFTKFDPDSDIDKDEYILSRLKMFELDEYINSYPSDLSGGQQKKVNILLTFATNPRLILFDELLSGLDQKTISNVMDFINAELTEKKISSITVSHNSEEIFKTCDKVLFLKNGVFFKERSISSYDSHNDLYNDMNEVISSNINLYAYDAFFKKENIYEFEEPEKRKSILISSLKKSYQNKHVITGLNNEGISLSINDSERVAIIGNNGSGKSTLAEMIVGAKKQTSGTILLSIMKKQKNKKIDEEIKIQQMKLDANLKLSPQNDEVIDECNIKINELISEKDYIYEKNSSKRGLFVSMQFQKQYFPSAMNLRDIIKFSLLANEINVTEEYIKYLLNIVGLGSQIYSKTIDLSGGERQKLNVVLTLLSRPNVLILDELSTGLDIQAQAMLSEIINEFVSKEKIILIMITHSLSDIKKFTDRVLVLRDGYIKDDLKVCEKNMNKIESYLKNLDS